MEMSLCDSSLTDRFKPDQELLQLAFYDNDLDEADPCPNLEQVHAKSSSGPRLILGNACAVVALCNVT